MQKIRGSIIFVVFHSIAFGMNSILFGSILLDTILDAEKYVTIAPTIAGLVVSAISFVGVIISIFFIKCGVNEIYKLLNEGGYRENAMATKMSKMRDGNVTDR